MAGRHCGLVASSRAIVATALICLASPARAQSVDPSFWVTNGDVRDMAISGSTLYLAGTFTNLAPASGRGVPFDATGSAIPGFPKVTGSMVRAAVSDGAGGWFIGGIFTHVGGLPRANLAHIASDMTVTAWNPGANNSVFSMTLSGGVLYVGGFFTNVGGFVRNYVAAIDPATGAVLAWNPGTNGGVYALLVTGGIVYLGGIFTNVGGMARNYLAAVHATTGAVQAFSPNPNAQVHSLAVNSTGAVLYLGGMFTSIGLTARNHLGSVAAQTGGVTLWNPNVNALVQSIAVSGTTVYVGGDFSTVGGQGRNRVAEIDATTGAPTAWNANVTNANWVTSLQILGSTLYFGGNFATVGGQPRRHAAAVDLASAALQPWDPRPNDAVYAMGVSGTSLYVGGLFTGIGGVDRSCLAAMDLTTGMPTSWNPIGVVGTVQTILLSGGTLYAGGFDAPYLKAFDAVTGAAIAGFSPNPNSYVNELAQGDGVIYVGGSFSSIGGQPRVGVAALNPATGASTAWSANTNAGGGVYAMALDGATLYAGGIFTSISGVARNNLAALDVASGAATPWNPGASSAIYTIVPHGGVIYLCGFFNTIGGAVRNLIAALDPATGLATAWNPNATSVASGVPRVNVLRITGDVAWAGGLFEFIGGQNRVNVAALDLVSGAALPWNAGINELADVNTMAVTSTHSYLGGTYDAAGGTLPQSRLTALSPVPTGVPPVPVSGFGTSVVASIPNPLDGDGFLRVRVSRRERVTLRVLDITGRSRLTVLDRVLEPGLHDIPIATRRLPAGVYIAALEANALSARRIVVAH